MLVQAEACLRCLKEGEVHQLQVAVQSMVQLLAAGERVDGQASRAAVQQKEVDPWTPFVVVEPWQDQIHYLEQVMRQDEIPAMSLEQVVGLGHWFLLVEARSQQQLTQGQQPLVGLDRWG